MTPLPCWRVSLPGSPTFVVEARDEAAAWEAYKRKAGVVDTAERHHVAVATREEFEAAEAYLRRRFTYSE